MEPKTMATLQKNNTSTMTEPSTNHATSRSAETQANVVDELSQHLSSLNTKYCDRLSQQLDRAFQTVLPDFPRLDESASKQQKLLDRLHQSYIRHVDVVEVYAARNIFTLDNVPPNRRARIAALFVKHNKHNGKEIVLELKDPPYNKEDITDTALSIAKDVAQMTSGTAPPPTQEQIQAQRQAVQALQQQMAQARTRYAVLQRRVQELDVAHSMTTTVTTTTSKDAVQESVTAVSMGVHGLEDVVEQGQAAVQQAKKQKLSQDDENDGLAWENASPPPKNVHELYQKERQRCQATTEDWQRVHQMLVGDKNKANRRRSSSASQKIPF